YSFSVSSLRKGGAPPGIAERSGGRRASFIGPQTLIGPHADLIVAERPTFAGIVDECNPEQIVLLRIVDKEMRRRMSLRRIKEERRVNADNHPGAKTEQPLSARTDPLTASQAAIWPCSWLIAFGDQCRQSRQ